MRTVREVVAVVKCCECEALTIGHPVCCVLDCYIESANEHIFKDGLKELECAACGSAATTPIREVPADTCQLIEQHFPLAI